MFPLITYDSNDLHRRSVRVFLCTLLAFPAMAYSQQWKLEPVVGLSAGYNDNVRLNLDSEVEIDATSITVDAKGSIVRRAPTSEVRIAPRIRSRNYVDDSLEDPGESLEDANDFFFDFFARNDMQRGQTGIQARFWQEDVLTAEIDDPDFDNPDVNDPVNLDTGRIQAENERETFG